MCARAIRAIVVLVLAVAFGSPRWSRAAQELGADAELIALRMGTVEVSPCEDVATVSIELDSTQPAAGLQIALKWDPELVDVLEIAPGQDLAPDEINAFFETSMRARRRLASS